MTLIDELITLHNHEGKQGLMAILRSWLKNQRGIIFSRTGIWIPSPSNQEPVCNHVCVWAGNEHNKMSQWFRNEQVSQLTQSRKLSFVNGSNIKWSTDVVPIKLIEQKSNRGQGLLSLYCITKMFCLLCFFPDFHLFCLYFHLKRQQIK